MNVAPPLPSDNAEQIAYWNGIAGERWTRRQEMQDALLARISEAVVAHANARPGERIIDIGCGCGASTLELAAKVGAQGHVLGIDISTPMVTRARERAGSGSVAEFIETDATDHAFAPKSVDMLFSRFGVMFFADPVRAFANLRRALKPGGRLAFVCWREPKQNPWMMVPLQAAYCHVPRMPEISPEAPGPFAFAREARVRAILEQAGFSSIALQPFDLEIDLAAGRGLEAAVESALGIGPASRAIDGQPPEAAAAATAEIRKTLAAVQVGETIPLPAAVWLVSARTP